MHIKKGATAKLYCILARKALAADVAAFFAGGELATVARIENIKAHGCCNEEILRTVGGQQDTIMRLYPP